MNKMLVWIGLIVLILGLIGTMVAYKADDIDALDTGNSEVGDEQMTYVYAGVGVLVLGVIILLMGMMMGGAAPAETEEMERTCMECGAYIADPMATECPECGAPLEPMEEVRDCPECGAVITDPYATECPECGAPLSFEEEDVRSCPECGGIIEDPEAVECPECGAPLPEPEEAKDEEIADDQVECPNCGAMIPADAMECSVCGVEFEDEEEEEEKEEEEAL